MPVRLIERSHKRRTADILHKLYGALVELSKLSPELPELPHLLNTRIMLHSDFASWNSRPHLQKLVLHAVLE